MTQILISCPITGDLVPTGVYAFTIEDLATNPYLLERCPDCDEAHEWIREDATISAHLTGFGPSRAGPGRIDAVLAGPLATPFCSRYRGLSNAVVGHLSRSQLLELLPHCSLRLDEDGETAAQTSLDASDGE